MADNLKEIICPACGRKMEKIFIEHTGFHLDICLNGCGGIFFDNREFKHFDEQAENIEAIEQATVGKEFYQADESFKRYCPICKTPMVKNFSSANKTVEIDECYVCGGKFLDNQELQKIRAEYETEDDRSKAVMNAFAQSLPPEYAAEIKKAGIWNDIIDWKKLNEKNQDNIMIEEHVVDIKEFRTYD